jgi:hypothetical protein
MISKYGMNKEKISNIMWVLLFFVSLRVIGNLAYAVYYFTLDFESSMSASIFFLLYLFSLIGLVKNYRWSLFLIMLISLTDIGLISFYRITGSFAIGALFGDFILIALPIIKYNRETEEKSKDRKLDRLSKILAILSAFFLLGYISQFSSPLLRFRQYNLVDLFLILGFGYTIYKTFIGKQKLSVIEKVFSLSLFFIFFLNEISLEYSTNEGFFQNQTISSYYTTTTVTTVNYTYTITLPKIPLTTYYLLDNKTLTIPSRSYYVYPIKLAGNTTVRFVAESINDGIFNTVLVNSTEYEKLTRWEGGIVYYYVGSYTSGVKKADIKVTVDNNDTYYFIVSTTPIFKDQATYDYPTDVVLTVYISD